MKLTFWNARKALLRAAPELGEGFTKMCEKYRPEPPGQYLIFEDLLHPYLAGLFESEDKPDVLKRIFELFEEMARSRDGLVTDLLGVAELEWLFANPSLLSKAWNYMGEATKSMAKEMASQSGGRRRLPPQ